MNTNEQGWLITNDWSTGNEVAITCPALLLEEISVPFTKLLQGSTHLFYFDL